LTVIAEPIVHRLANGVRVVCDPVAGFETLALSVVIGRGARHERADQSGWAHLLEHMVFKGAGQRSARDIVEAVEAAGGHINAATGHERTSFQVRALKGGLPLAMAVTADLVLRPTLDAGDLEREKQVVAQEIAEAADAPDDLVFELAQAAAFAEQPLGRPILGSSATVGAASPESLAGFRDRLYAPDAIVVSASGAVDPDELMALTERWFAEPARAEPPLAEPAAFTGGLAPTARRLEQAHMVLLLPAPGARDPDYFALRLFAEILGGGMSSRLFQEVREHRGLAYAIDAYADTNADIGVLGIYAGASAADAGEAAGLAAGELLSLVRDGPRKGELERAKAQLKGATFMARESALARAEQAASQLLLFDRTLTAAEIAEAVDAVTPADIVRIGERLVAPRRCAGAVLGPKRAVAAAERFQRALFR
jgi:predicted Zn-dependent peptidase